MSEESKAMTVLVCALAASLTIECMDELKDTPGYRQELKNQGNRFYKLLEAHAGEILPLIWGLRDSDMYQIMEYQKKVITKLATMDAEEAGVVDALIDKYLLNKAEVLEYLGVRVVSSDSPDI